MKTRKLTLALLASALAVPVIVLAVDPLGPVVSIPAPTGQPPYWGYGKSVADCPSGSVFTGLETTQFSANGDTVNEWTPFNIDKIHCRSTTASLGPQVNVNAPTGYSPYDAYGSKRISECPSGSVLTGLETTQFTANGDTVNEATPFNIDRLRCRTIGATSGSSDLSCSIWFDQDGDATIVHWSSTGLGPTDTFDIDPLGNGVPAQGQAQ